MENLLLNGNFNSGEWCRDTHTGQQFGEIFAPKHWVAFWKEGLPVPHDPNNRNGYGRPEMKVIPKLAPYLDPPRVAEGAYAMLWFTFYRIHDAGIYQQVSATPGKRYSLSALAHAWSSVDDDPRHSSTDGDGVLNVAFRVGIDPTGGTDPWADSVVWGNETRNYDAYGPVSGLTVTAQADSITVFVRSTVMWPFKHCDAYVDNVILEAVPDEPTVEPVDYVVTTELLPQDATLAEKLYVLTATHAMKRTLTQSTGDAARLVAPGLPGSAVNVWAVQRHPAGIVQWLHDEGVETVNLFEFGETEPPAPLPDPDPDPNPDPTWMPRNYVDKGTKLGFHCVGGYPADVAAQLSREGVTLSSMKFVQAIGDLAIAAEHWTLGRIIDHAGHNLEGFDYNGDPIGQAEARMAALMPLFAPYRDKVDFIEIINEQAPPNDAAHVKLANFFLRAMQIAEANGFKLALFSHSVGTPENGAWTAIANTGVFEAAARGGHAISLHEYGDARYAPDSVLCRYRWLYQNIILPKRLNIPLFITEFAVWEQLLGQVDSLEHWIAYDRLARQDPYVAGIHVYSTGMAGAPYVPATVACLQRFAQYAIAEKNVVNR